MRIAFISQAPTPYLTSILNELANLADLHVIFMTGRRPAKSVDSWATFNDPWGAAPQFQYSLYRSAGLTFPGRDFHAQLSVGISFKLRRLHPDVVLVHGWGPLMAEPIVWSALNGHRTVMWTESTSFSGLLRGRFSNRLRRALMRLVDAFVSNGTLATEYAETLGVGPGRIVTGRLAAPPLRVPLEPSGHRASSGARILFVGRLVPLKRLSDLLAAFSSVHQKSPEATLTVVGDGPLRRDLEERSRAAGVEVRWLGRLEGAELHSVYAAHDLIVVPSEREVWGLVVNEALASGLYVVASSEVGSAHDLLGPGIGVVYQVGDVQALTALLEATLNGLDCSPAGRAARRASVESVTPRAFAEAMRDAANLAISSRPSARRHD